MCYKIGGLTLNKNLVCLSLKLEVWNKIIDWTISLQQYWVQILPYIFPTSSSFQQLLKVPCCYDLDRNHPPLSFLKTSSMSSEKGLSDIWFMALNLSVDLSVNMLLDGRGGSLELWPARIYPCSLPLLLRVSYSLSVCLSHSSFYISLPPKDVETAFFHVCHVFCLEPTNHGLKLSSMQNISAF